MDALEHQRLRLRGVRWISFYNSRYGDPKLKKQFHAEGGLHFDRSAIAIMTDTDFVMILRYIDKEWALYSQNRSFALKAQPLNPRRKGYFTLGRVFPNSAPILMNYIVPPEEFRDEQPEAQVGLLELGPGLSQVI